MANTSRFPFRWWILCAVAPLWGMAALPVPGMAQPVAPNFQMPFPCGQVWTGSTYEYHRPVEAVDFNRPEDIGDPVVASQAGTVSRSEDDGDTSYGLWVGVDHGDGWVTRYGHLSAQDVRVGDVVQLGQRLGNVGSTGNSTGPHLHYEQRSGGVPVKITFDGAPLHYFGKEEYTSRNSC